MKKLRQHVSFEQVVEHLKSDHRKSRNSLSGVFGVNINVLLADAGYN